MSNLSYIEDIFNQFYTLIYQQQLLISKQDLTATYSLHEYCVDDNKFLTLNQSNYLLKILSRYQSESAQLGLDYKDSLISPQWKKVFRTLDLSKKVFVEQDKDKKWWICLKFPFSLKETFDNEIKNERSNSDNNKWDHDRKLRLVEVYKHNVMHINEFVNHHGFDIDNTFLSLVSEVEEIWQQQDSITTYAVYEDNSVRLVNAVADAETYFNERKTGIYEEDIFLAKTMGYPLRLSKIAGSVLENICSKNTNQFWLKENNKFFELHNQAGGKSAILLDRNTKDIVGWLKNFVYEAENAGCKDQIKICFRESGDDHSGLNSWIKENNLGGKVEQGKIFIFLQKPPKWLFRDKIDVKIVGTNCYVPPLSDSITAPWLFAHPCLCYLGDIKPTVIRNYKIVSV